MALGRPLRAAAFVFAVVICATSGCGLPDARPDLPAPEEGDNASPIFQRFTFVAPLTTAAPFLGVELYYRFSTVGSERERDMVSLALLLQRQFHRIARDDDRVSDINPPLIERPAAGEVVTLYFSRVDLGTVAIFRDGDGVERRVPLLRAVSRDGRYKPFTCDEFADVDVDIGSVVDQLAVDCSTSAVQLQVYALSFGRTPDGIAVYSDAVDLGTIDLTFRNP